MLKPLALTVALLAGTALPAAAATTSPADTQLAWLVRASQHEPISTTEITQHFDQAAITAAGGAAALAATLDPLGAITVQQTVLDTPTAVEVIATITPGPATLGLTVDPAGLIDGLTFQPYAPQPTTWAGIDTELRGIAPQLSFAASEIEPNGRCDVVHGITPNTQRPLGSAFKLYVLGALGQAVADGRASWNEDLAIHDAWKSLPSGVLQNEPDGTELPLTEYADKMISISDNTAADHLIHFLGRNAVQAQLFRFHNEHPSADIPFLTTRELFDLKGVQYPTLANSYLSLPRPSRAAALDALDQIPRSDITLWTRPRNIDQIEYFASPTDICRAYAGLRLENKTQPQIGQALSINDAGIHLDPATYPTVWFKGGSEPGVLTLNWMVQAANGRTMVISILWGNQSANINMWTSAGVAFAVTRAALTLSPR